MMKMPSQTALKLIRLTTGQIYSSRVQISREASTIMVLIVANILAIFIDHYVGVIYICGYKFLIDVSE